MLFTPIRPMLLQMGTEVQDDFDKIFQIKWDGFRILIHKSGNRLEAYTRHGTNVTLKFPELQMIGNSIKAKNAIIDCEGVVLRNGNDNFADFAFRGRLSNQEKIKHATITHPVTFIAFDILQTGDESHLNKPLRERKQILSSLIEPNNYIQITPSIVGEGKRIFQFTKERNMEGIVAKRLDSTYQINTRSDDWIKYKHFKIAENIKILGYKEEPFSLIVGEQMMNGQYRALANVEFGFKQHEKNAFRQIAPQLVTRKEKGVTWLEPRLSCSVQYLERTSTGSLRIVSFKGFNIEKLSEEIVVN